MKITLINGSPKRRDSASGVILSQLKGYMKSDASLCELHFFTPHPQPEQLQAAADSDVLIFAFPLYVDGIPSHMVSALLDLETVIREKKKKRTVYAILNSGAAAAVWSGDTESGPEAAEWSLRLPMCLLAAARAHPLGKRFAVLQRTAPHKEPEKQSLSRWIFPDLPTKLLRKWVGDRP